MKVDLGGPVANAHFHTSEEIELDLDPREIGSQASLDEVLDFCSKLSLALERDVAITEESDPEKKLAVLLVQTTKLADRNSLIAIRKADVGAAAAKVGKVRIVDIQPSPSQNLPARVKQWLCQYHSFVRHAQNHHLDLVPSNRA